MQQAPEELYADIIGTRLGRNPEAYIAALRQAFPGKTVQDVIQDPGRHSTTNLREAEINQAYKDLLLERAPLRPRAGDSETSKAGHAVNCRAKVRWLLVPFPAHFLLHGVGVVIGTGGEKKSPDTKRRRESEVGLLVSNGHRSDHLSPKVIRFRHKRLRTGPRNITL
jgi:hypothetical protein